MKIYHGTANQIEIKESRAMYFGKTIEIAKEYAKGLDDCGNYNEKSFIYSMEINEKNINIEDDFMVFDTLAYFGNSTDMSDIVYNSETKWFCVKNPKNVKLEQIINN